MLIGVTAHATQSGKGRLEFVAARTAIFSSTELTRFTCAQFLAAVG